MKLSRLPSKFLKTVKHRDDDNMRILTDGQKFYAFFKVKLSADGKRVYGNKSFWNLVSIKGKHGEFNTPKIEDCGAFLDEDTLDGLIKAGIYSVHGPYSDLRESDKRHIARAHRRVGQYCSLRDHLEEAALYTDSDKLLTILEYIEKSLAIAIINAPREPAQ